MTLLDAIRAAENGAVIVSNAGATYTAADLSPITWIGPFAVSYRTCIPENERKGAWRIAEA